MKTKFFLVLCLLLLAIKCGENKDDGFDTDKCEKAKYDKKENCFSAYNETEQAEGDGHYCCYVDYKITKNREGEEEINKGCMDFSKDEYDDLDAWKKDVEENNEVEYLELYCNEEHSVTISSCFLKLGLVSLISALLI